IESVDLKDLVAFASNLDFQSQDVLRDVINFAAELMRNVGATELLRRVGSLREGTARKPPNEVELAAMAFADAPDRMAAVNLLVEINKQAGVTQHRPAILRACISALRTADDTPENSFY